MFPKYMAEQISGGLSSLSSITWEGQTGHPRPPPSCSLSLLPSGHRRAKPGGDGGGGALLPVVEAGLSMAVVHGARHGAVARCCGPRRQGWPDKDGELTSFARRRRAWCCGLGSGLARNPSGPGWVLRVGICGARWHSGIRRRQLPPWWVWSSPPSLPTLSTASSRLASCWWCG
jgi:hypothetical protein